MYIISPVPETPCLEAGDNCYRRAGCTYFHLHQEPSAWKLVIIITKDGDVHTFTCTEKPECLEDGDNCYKDRDVYTFTCAGNPTPGSL
jgi:hypothetical protein